MARPIATLCLCPPESSFGFRSSNSVICKISAASRTF